MALISQVCLFYFIYLFFSFWPIVRIYRSWFDVHLQKGRHRSSLEEILYQSIDKTIVGNNSVKVSICCLSSHQLQGPTTCIVLKTHLLNTSKEKKVKPPFWAHLCILHGGLICIAFCPSIRLSVCHWIIIHGMVNTEAGGFCYDRLGSLPTSSCIFQWF